MMANNFTQYARLEPRPSEQDWESGFTAAIHDPVWFLGRQWQLGEYQGENASSPIWIDYTLRKQRCALPIRASTRRLCRLRRSLNRRSMIGGRWGGGCVSAEKSPLPTLPCSNNPTLCFHNPPPPYEQFHGQLDGWLVWCARVDLGVDDADFGALIPADSSPAWNSEQLHYQQDADDAFTAGSHSLQVTAHRGGRLDWYNVGAESAEAVPEVESEQRQAVPTALHYPGAPASRWWQIEDAEVDFGGYAPDSAHTATALLTNLIFSHGDDWFLFPVAARGGHVVSMDALVVWDVFGRNYRSSDIDQAGQRRWPGLQPPDDWTLFQVNGLPSNALLLWHVAELPLESLPIERVQFGLDEEANLLWAVERIVDGREVASRRTSQPDADGHLRFNEGLPSGDTRDAGELAYVPGEGAAPFWHPYEIDEVDGVRRLVQRRLVDFSRQKPLPLPQPQSELLQPVGGHLHRLAPLAIPSNGIEVERRWQLARDMQGQPVLWLQRQRVPLLSSPARRLRFDVMAVANQF